MPAAAAVALERIRAAADRGLGLLRVVFPDGELGRPGDNLYRLTYAEVRPHKLLLELDEQLLLVLTDVDLDRDGSAGPEVVMRFRQATLDWQEYGSLTPHASTWQTGTVIVCPQ